MAVDLEVAGEKAPQTRNKKQVLAAMVTLRAANQGIRPPALIPLLRRKLVVYRREKRSRDHYLTWWQVLETSRSVKAWKRANRLTWGKIVRSKQLWAKVLELLARDPAKADCEDLSMWHAVALETGKRKLRTWATVQEFDAYGRVVGWHALVVAEVPKGVVVLGEVPKSGSLWVAHLPHKAKPRPGYRLALIDAAWMAGMRRPDQGVFTV